MVLNRWIAPNPQWWFVTTSPASETNDAVQPPRCTAAESTPPFVGCQNSSFVIFMPLASSFFQSMLRIWIGSHWPSSGAGERMRTARNVKAIFMMV